jgi:hypothetical protein
VAWPKYLFGDFEACEQDSVEFVVDCAERKLEQLRLWTVLLYECARAMRHPSVENIAALRTAIDTEHQSGTPRLKLIICISTRPSRAKGGQRDGSRSGASRSLRSCRNAVNVFGLPTYTAYPVMSC